VLRLTQNVFEAGGEEFTGLLYTTGERRGRGLHKETGLLFDVEFIKASTGLIVMRSVGIGHN
jgi:tRNA U34 2-thiouridine synthase MnmA/TrmU